MVGREDNTLQTLLDLGFERYPEWDYPGKDPTPQYRLVTPHGTFRAYEERHNGPRYVRLGQVVNEAGQVCAWGWMDCDSPGSVARKIAPPAEGAAPRHCCAYCARASALHNPATLSAKP
jgi:hypothetical protein